MSIFSVFQPNDTTGVLSTEITTGLWSPNETGSLVTAFTASNQKAVSGEFFYDVYSTDPATNTTAEVQFAVAYGHIDGGGSPPLALKNDSTLPTEVIYSQYKNILLTSGSRFTFGGTSSSDIYVINVNRARIKQALDAGNWQLGLSGSRGLFSFIDDSNLTSNVVGNIVASNVYNVRSGSISTGTASYGDSIVYGLVFPDYGAIILNPSAISSSVGFSGSNSTTLNANTLLTVPFTPFTGSTATLYQYQHEALLRSISGSMRSGRPFVARSVEKVSSKNYSVYLRYDEFNYTNNPSYYTVNNGVREILPVFKENPITYITTIGLYNDANELLAVAKLSRPIQKSKDKAALIRVRLDY